MHNNEATEEDMIYLQWHNAQSRNTKRRRHDELTMAQCTIMK